MCCYPLKVRQVPQARIKIMDVEESISTTKEETIATVVVATPDREIVTAIKAATSNQTRTSDPSARIASPTSTEQEFFHLRITPTTLSFANEILFTIVEMTRRANNRMEKMRRTLYRILVKRPGLERENIVNI